MILSRTPLRMSFVGGGTDLPAFYREEQGVVVSTAISKYIYVSANPKFDGGIRLAYSKTEEVDHLQKIQHRLFRATFEVLGVGGGIEVTTTADIPSKGTGLGSSSSFTVGVLNVMAAYLKRPSCPQWLAETACQIEIEHCGEPIGKQDQYAAAFGGLNALRFNPDGTVEVCPINIPEHSERILQERILVLYTGSNRSASAILKDQADRTTKQRSVRLNLRRMAKLAEDLREGLERGDLSSFGGILEENWSLKKQLSGGISTSAIDEWHDAAIAAGAEGGKLLGAGAGGFLMFYADPERHEAIVKAVGLRRIDISFDKTGSQIIFPHPIQSHSA